MAEPSSPEQIQLLLEQTLQKVPRPKLVQLWRAVASGALGRGERAEAVRRGLVARLNYKRIDHARRLFLSIFEQLLVRDPALLWGTPRLPGLFHLIDLSAFWLAMKEGVLGDLATDITLWLAEQTRRNPIDEVLAWPAALDRRHMLRNAALDTRSQILSNSKSAKRFLMVVNHHRTSLAAQHATAPDIQLEALTSSDIEEFFLALEWAHALEAAGRETEAVRIGYADWIEVLVATRERVRAAMGKSHVGQPIQLWPLMSFLHQQRQFTHMTPLMDGVTDGERLRLIELLVAHVRVACESIRQLWAKTAENTVDDNDLLLGERGMAVLAQLIGTFNEDNYYSGHRREAFSFISHLRFHGLELAGHALSKRLADIRGQEYTPEEYFRLTLRLCHLMVETSNLGEMDKKPFKAFEDWQNRESKLLYEQFKRANECAKESHLMGFIARLTGLCQAIGGDPSTWYHLNSPMLVRAARSLFAQTARGLGDSSQALAEEWAIAIANKVLVDMRQQSHWRDATLTGLIVAARDWCERHGRSLNEVGEDDVLNGLD
jgi:hypothetical protein